MLRVAGCVLHVASYALRVLADRISLNRTKQTFQSKIQTRLSLTAQPATRNPQLAAI